MKALILSILAILTLPASAERKHAERWYQERIAKIWGAKMEVRVANGRVDIVSKEYATEVEFADKWKEAIGQALWYALQTNKKAGIVLICEDKSDYLHAIRLRSTIQYAKLDIKVWTHDELLKR